MPQKQNGSSKRKNKQCLTLTGDVTDILRAINFNNTQKSLKSNTSKFTKTITKNEQQMTEDDLDQLFNNAGKLGSNPLKNSHTQGNNLTQYLNYPNKTKNSKASNNQTHQHFPAHNKVKQSTQKPTKIKTEVKIDMGWANQLVCFNDTFKSDKNSSQLKHKNFANTCKFLRVQDQWDRLLTGLPTNLITENNLTEQNQFDQDKIDALFGANQNLEGQKTSQQRDLTQQFKRNYLVGKIVGQGAYASVRVAIHKPTNKKIAIKVYEKGKIKDPQRKKSVRRQIKILQLLDHPNIVKIFDVVETNHHLNIIMEYLSGISLSSYLKNQPGYKASQKNCKKIIKPLVEALKHIHSRNIAHRDIKLQNIILQDNLSPKLIDFGFSTCIQPCKKVKIFCGTPSYMAPQIVQKKEYRGQPADIWAVGVLFFVCLTGIFPFKGATDQQLYKKIMSADYPRLQIPSKQTADLISKMLKVSPEQRITANEILSHSWMRSSKETLSTAQTPNPLQDMPSKSNKLNNTNNVVFANKKGDSMERKKRTTTVSSHKSRQDAGSKSNHTKKLTQTYKENLKLELKLAKQSPSNRRINVSGTNLKKDEVLCSSSNYYNNLNLNLSGHVNVNVNAKFLKTQKIGTLNSSKKDCGNKAHAKVLDLLRMEMKKRQQQKSKIKSRRV